jgi:hypothetical protein
LYYFICIDDGYGSTKVKTIDSLYKFESKSQIAMNNDGTIIRFYGKNYQVGTGLDDISMDKMNNDNPTHKLCILRPIAENVPENQDTYVILDLPLTHYYNDEYKNDMKKFLLETKSILFNGKEKKVNIYSTDITQYSNRVVGILDIGALTTSGVIIDNLKPVKNSMFSIDFGTKILENKIKTNLNQALLLNLQDYSVPYIIKDGFKHLTNVEKEISEMIIAKTIEEFFMTLKRQMLANNWILDELDILGVGGGVLTLKDYLYTYFHYAEIDNPIYANVLGLWNIGKAIMKG